MAKAQREFTKPPEAPQAEPADDSLFGDAPSSEQSSVESEPPVEPAEPPESAAEPQPALITKPALDAAIAGYAAPQVPAGFKPFPTEPFPGRYGEPPYDHAPVQLTPDGERFMVAQWQVSRRWSGAKPGVAPRWESYGFWAIRATGGRPITFTPTGWREHRD